MTSIIGIRTSQGTEGIVLGADTQFTHEYDDGSNSEKTSAPKIVVGRNWAITGEGDTDRAVKRFYGILLGHRRYESSEERAKEIVSEAINTSFMQLANETNRDIMKRRKNLDTTVSFLLATRLPKLGLWRIDPFGNVIDVSEDIGDGTLEYISMGAGSKKIDDYISEFISEGKDPNKIAISDAIDLVFNSLRRAERDIYTSGPIDLVVITEERIDSWSSKIKNDRVKADKRTQDEIREKYTQQQVK